MKKCAAWLVLMLALRPTLVLCAQPPVRSISPAQHLRPDLKSKWEKRLCTNKTPPTMPQLWQAGIYDAQLQAHFMTPKPGMIASDQLMGRAAAILAERASHNGFDYGLCPAQSSGWVITSPAAGDFVQRKNPQSILLSWSAVRPYCQEAHIDYVAAASGRARNLLVLTHADLSREIKLDATLLADGTISVTCYPLYGKNLGPELWYLVPVKEGPPAVTPGSETLAQTEALYAPTLLRWINELRASAGVAAVSPLANSHARRLDRRLLAQNDSIHHDIQHLKSVQTMLQRSGGAFIGEDRVKGQDLSEMAWLLWNSPRHRDLLLNTKADSLAVSQINDKTQRLLVLTFAKYSKERTLATD